MPISTLCDNWSTGSRSSFFAAPCTGYGDSKRPRTLSRCANALSKMQQGRGRGLESKSPTLQRRRTSSATCADAIEQTPTQHPRQLVQRVARNQQGQHLDCAPGARIRVYRAALAGETARIGQLTGHGEVLCGGWTARDRKEHIVGAFGQLCAAWSADRDGGRSSGMWGPRGGSADEVFGLWLPA